MNHNTHYSNTFQHYAAIGPVSCNILLQDLDSASLYAKSYTLAKIDKGYKRAFMRASEKQQRVR